MLRKIIELPVQTTSAGIKKEFKSADAVRVLSELTWNGLDAGATIVDISTQRNELEGLECISIEDNGTGINFNDKDNCGFTKFADSHKKADINTHGKKGIGRFSFHKLSNQAEWTTQINNKTYVATIDESQINKIKLQEVDQSVVSRKFNTGSGTLVRLTGFNAKNGKLPNEDETLESLSSEFGWFLAYRPKLKILFNHNKINIPEHDYKNIKVSNDWDFDISIFRWFKKPSENSNIYFVDESNKVVHKILSRFNNKTGFYSSVVISSNFNNKLDPDLFELDGSKEIINEISQVVHEALSEIYDNFLRTKANDLINSYENKGFFNYKNNASSEIRKLNIENTKTVVKEIYIAEPKIFNNINDKSAKILVRLLDKILVSNENTALYDVLDGVLDLDSIHVEKLASLIKDTKLENIISTIEIISRRLQVIKMLRSIMTNDYKSVLETPDLQKVVEANSWLFGEQYSILGAEEDDFNKTAKRLRDEIPSVTEIDISDIEDTEIDISKRQVDLFLSSKKMAFDENNKRIYKCVIIEIKRPSISLNKKHLRQLEDYAEIIQNSSEFGISDKLRFDLILVGRKIANNDTSISGKLESMKVYHDKGLVGLSENRKIKCYVKDWFSLLDEHELSSDYILETLKPKLPDYSKNNSKELIEKMQQPI